MKVLNKHFSFQDVHSTGGCRFRRFERSQVLRDHRQDGVRQLHRPGSADHREHGPPSQEALHPRLRHVDEALLHRRHPSIITGN